MSSSNTSQALPADAVVIGAGFGGLATALRLAEHGARVVVVERLTYPGGCASTFTRQGVRYEAGATLFSGFAPGQLFAEWMAKYDLDVVVDTLHPTIAFASSSGTLDVSPDRAVFVDEVVGRSQNPKNVQAFLEWQGRLADVLWTVLQSPELLPPLTLSTVAKHLLRTPRYASLVPWLGRPLASALRHFDVDNEPLLRSFLNALCQITVQCSVDEAETAFALSTMDYPFRGTGHVKGGIGRLASGLVDAVGQAGGDVRFADEARRLERKDGGWVVHTRKGTWRTPVVVANLVPSALGRLLEDTDVVVDEEAERDWSAAMWYGTMRVPADEPHFAERHLQLVHDDTQPLQHGNHLFVSIGAVDDERGTPPGTVAFTASSHVDLRAWRAAGEAGTQAGFVDDIQQKMKQTLQLRAPAWADRVVSSMPGSPRTFARFTARPDGWVGGVPRRAGLLPYLKLGPDRRGPGLWLVGDSSFLGQSTLAVATSGVRTADAIAKGRTGWA